MEDLFNDFKRYKTTNIGFHAGDVFEHSVWSGFFVWYMFQTKHKNVTGLNPKFERLLIAAALLHDIGKGGDNALTFFDKPNHPEIGGYYFEQNKYITVDGKKLNLLTVLDDLHINRNQYSIIKFLVKYHWMIGGILADMTMASQDRVLWKLYYDFNIVYHNEKIEQYSRVELFMMLYVVWTADLMATQRFPYSIEGFPYSIKNPPAVHPGQNMYIIHKIDQLTIRTDLLKIYIEGYEHFDFSNDFIFYGRQIKSNGNYYISGYSQNPFIWKKETQEEKDKREIEENKEQKPVRFQIKTKKFSELKVPESYLIPEKICKDRMKDPMDIPLFQGFPEIIKGLNRDQICKVYGVAVHSDIYYGYEFPYPVESKDFNCLIVNQGQKLYHGRGYTECEPPNIGIEKAFWVFLEKKYAYTYATGRDEFAMFPIEGKYCWNLITYKTKKQLELINLSDIQVRNSLRAYLKDFNIADSWYIRLGLFDHTEYPTFEDVLNYMFPNDLDPTQPDRVSQTEVDIPMAKFLGKVLVGIDGWFIESKSMLPEVVIFKPYEILEQIKIESFDGERMTELLNRCTSKGISDIDCKSKITKMFKSNELVCLNYPDKIHCYLIEEFMDNKIVSPEEYEKIKESLAQGESNIIMG